jgi:hypothetical protein
MSAVQAMALKHAMPGNSCYASATVNGLWCVRNNQFPYYDTISDLHLGEVQAGSESGK